MRLCLVEDSAVSRLEPVTLTRAIFDLLLGASSLGDKIAHAFGVGPGPARRGLVVRSHLASIERERQPHTAVNDPDWLARDPVVVANGRWIPPVDFVVPDEGRSWMGTCAGQPACALVGPDRAVGLETNSVDAWFEEVAASAAC